MQKPPARSSKKTPSAITAKDRPGTTLAVHLGGPGVPELSRFADCQASTPLWQRVPTHDEFGHLLADFRMIFPGLKSQEPIQQLHTLREIAGILERYASWVVFADLSLRTNLLWVSIRARPGLTLEIPAAILDRLPEARLLAPYWRSR